MNSMNKSGVGILFLFYFFSFTESRIMVKNCNYYDKDTCLNHWPCMWCNSTETDLMLGINQSHCKAVLPCEFNQTKLPCVNLKMSIKYNLQCRIMSTFIWMMIFQLLYINDCDLWVSKSYVND